MQRAALALLAATILTGVSAPAQAWTWTGFLDQLVHPNRPNGHGHGGSWHYTDPRGTFSPPGKYTLALGDSIAYGFQVSILVDELNNTGEVDPTTFIGWVDDFVKHIAHIRRDVQAVNLSCPGESTDTFLDGGCPWTTQSGMPLHVDYTGSQMDAALAFLHQHPFEVSPITVTLGYADVYQNGDTPEAVEPRLAELLQKLRRAAPGVEIIVTQYYDPYAYFGDFNTANALDLNTQIATAAATVNARVLDPYPAFNLAQPQPDTLCALSNICGPFGDIHPTDEGYQTIGDLAWSISGYKILALLF